MTNYDRFATVARQKIAKKRCAMLHYAEKNLQIEMQL